LSTIALLLLSVAAVASLGVSGVVGKRRRSRGERLAAAAAGRDTERQISWAEFVSGSGEVMLQDLSYSSTLTYAVDLPAVISVTNATESSLGYVEAQGNGHALVFVRWTPR
jgi:hypothetical protein